MVMLTLRSGEEVPQAAYDDMVTLVKLTQKHPLAMYHFVSFCHGDMVELDLETKTLLKECALITDDGIHDVVRAIVMDSVVVEDGSIKFREPWAED